MPPSLVSLFFFFNDTATTEIYTLSLHDALPISKESLKYIGSPLLGKSFHRCDADVFSLAEGSIRQRPLLRGRAGVAGVPSRGDRKSTRLNSSHSQISYAVFCLKKKKNKTLRDHN